MIPEVSQQGQLEDFSGIKLKLQTMNFFVRDKLDSHEHKSVVDFFDSLNSYCIEQHPDWTAKIEGYRHTFFLGIDDDDKVICFANIILSNGPFKTANINFGPAFRDFEVITKGLQFLYNYFSSKRFIFFSIQLGIYISKQTELLEYNINHIFKVKYFYNTDNLWSSISVDLTRSETEILKSFTKGHQRKIKNPQSKIGLTATIQNNKDYLNSFIELYIKMHESRELPYDKINIINQFNNINCFIHENNKGFVEYIFEGENLVGGLIIIYQGNTARYYKGATDHERRDISILHLGLYEAMKYSKAKGCTTFDLWGYNHFAGENDQMYYINQFKKGFSDDFTFFPKRMNFILKPIMYKTYKFLKVCKKMIKR